MSRTIIAIVLLIGSGVVGFLYAKPQWQRFGELGVRVGDATMVSIELDELAKNQDALLAEINAVSQEDLARIDAALPVGPHGIEFLVALQGYVEDSGLTLKHVALTTPRVGRSQADQTAGSSRAPGQPMPTASDGPKERAGEVAELEFNIRVTGSYESLKLFLSALERSIRLVDMGVISFNVPQGGDAPEYNIRAKTYYQ